ncbi:sigma-70 family RNA polymerase sigma factor [Aureisphaera galaxeae]|uniref:RNA polymerase sigma factor n=1 Tax=Aureisphaera galaxeae TaxID=1538023 RepID=UPI0023500CEB|nr:sigma-70 family RNA polymerase sigma factor [Aureisphaera galaxeae]MDC8004891.1 sigma-70 family RNA polymerase sigma factor [Aureisphaera galaxeae]
MESTNSIDHTLNHLFRQESGKMVSVLIKIFGSENIEMAEDVVQDALLRALEVWKFRGVPDNPRAWLYRTAKNKAIDIIRKNKHSRTIDFSDPERQLLTSEYTLTPTMNGYWEEAQIQDDFLGMMYACCDPEISPENQVTFILKSLCGFSTKEVAKSFLTSETTISKRLYRTKEYFRNHKIAPQIPSSEHIASRTQSVLSAIYLMFNEGYNSTHSEDLIRNDLIFQSLHLCKAMLDNEKTQLPEVYALMALMCFHTSRVDSRLTEEGKLIRLEDQDRSLWNKELIAAGTNYLFKAGSGNTFSTYHCEASIAHQHCIAATYEDTNWKIILYFYNMLLSIEDDPVVALNRCLVISILHGPEQALKELKSLGKDPILDKYYLYHSSLAAMYEQLEEKDLAIDHFKKALELTQSKQEQLFLNERIDYLRDQ